MNGRGLHWIRSRWLRIIGGVALVAAAIAPSARASEPPPTLLVVSIDGLRPDYVSQAAEHGLKLPFLSELWREGARSAGVRGVLPTSTYPSHTTLVTGVAPATHGIYANQPFDSSRSRPTRWYWYAEELRVPTLWDVAAAAGFEVGSVSWPVTVGAEAIHYNIADFTGTRSEEDARMIRAWSGRAFMDELEEKAGPLLTDVRLGTARDWARTRYILGIIRRKRPRLMLTHFVATDYYQHQHGPFAPQAFAALEEIDEMVGQIVGAMRSVHPKAAVCVVSDHGFSAVENLVAVDAVFVRAGLIALESQKTSISEAGVRDWVAMPWPSGGSVAVVMKDPEDTAAHARVRDVLEQLAADPANGVAGILDRDVIARLGGAPSASFWIDFKPGYAQSPLLGPWTAMGQGRNGTHGYVPAHPEMNAFFLLVGPGVRPGDIGEIDMRSIAPTLARMLNVDLPSADLPPLDVFAESKK